MGHSSSLLTPPIATGVIGTGYAAKKRVAALSAHPWAQVVAIAGSHHAAAQELAAQANATVYTEWSQLLSHQPLDLVIIATKNHLHAAIAQAALTAGLSVVCEYPLALTVAEAAQLIELAKQRDRLLHVEHIELLGNVHQTVREYLPELGMPLYAHYTTISPKQPATGHWSFNHQECGFPLIAALSRISRFTDLFGAVATVSCRSRFWNIPDTDYYQACLCTAQLEFQMGAIVHLTYGKGERFPVGSRSLMLRGDRGTLQLFNDHGTFFSADADRGITLGSREGVFAEDTRQVLSHLVEGSPLYTTPADSLAALRVATAAEESATCDTLVQLSQ